MEKDISILKILDEIRLQTNFALLKVVDYWEADLCAIGLKNDKILIYISTYNHINNNEIKYDFDIELLDDLKQENLVDEINGRGYTQAELITLIKSKFEV